LISEKGEKQMFITTTKVAEMLGVTSQTVRVWSEEGRLPSYQYGRGRWRRYRLEEIEDFCSEKRTPAEKSAGAVVKGNEIEPT
jgi:excisionase family DNA binding protein